MGRPGREKRAGHAGRGYRQSSRGDLRRQFRKNGIRDPFSEKSDPPAGAADSGWRKPSPGKRAALGGQTEILRDLEKKLAELESQIRESDKRKSELEKIQFGYQEEAKPLQRRLTLIAIEEEETRSLVASENSEEEIYRTQEEALNEEIAILKAGLQGQEETGKTLEKSLEEAREVLTRISTEYSVLKEKGDHLTKAAARLQEALADRQGRRQKLTDRLAAGDRRNEDLEIKMAEARHSLVLFKTELERLGSPDPGGEPGLGK